MSIPDSAVVVKYVMEFNNRILLNKDQFGIEDIYAPRKDYDAVVRYISKENEEAGVLIIPYGMETIEGFSVLRWKGEPREHIAFKGVKMFPLD